MLLSNLALMTITRWWPYGVRANDIEAVNAVIEPGADANNEMAANNEVVVARAIDVEVANVVIVPFADNDEPNMIEHAMFADNTNDESSAESDHENTVDVDDRNFHQDRLENEVKAEREVYGSAFADLEKFLQDESDWNDESADSESNLSDSVRGGSSPIGNNASNQINAPNVHVTAEYVAVDSEQPILPISVGQEQSSGEIATANHGQIAPIGIDASTVEIDSDHVTQHSAESTMEAHGQIASIEFDASTVNNDSAQVESETAESEGAVGGVTIVTFNDSDDEELYMSFKGVEIGRPLQSDAIPTDFIKKEDDRISGSIPFKEETVCFYTPYLYFY